MCARGVAGPVDYVDTDGEHGPDPGLGRGASARPGTDPLLTRDATRAQVRIDTPNGRLPRGTSLTLIHAPASSTTPSASSPSASGARLGASAVSSRASASTPVAQPPIITRAQWGADESLRGRSPQYTDAIRAGFIHHTASSSGYTPAQAAAQVRAIYAYHTRSLGHSDIDYNFLVDRFGRLYEGRAGGIDRTVLGAHTAGFNEHTFAVSALGNFETFSPTQADMAAIRDSIARLFAWKLAPFGVSPTGTATLVSAGYTKPTRYPRGAVANLPVISSHLMTSFTSCPGKYLQAQIPAIRTLAERFVRGVFSAAIPSADGFVAGSRSVVTLASEASEAATWNVDILSPCSPVPIRTWTGSTSDEGPISVDWDLADATGAPVPPATYTVRVWGQTASDGRSAAVESQMTIAPAPGGAWGPCPDVSRVSGEMSAQASVLWGRILAPTARTVVLTGRATDSPAALAAGLAAAPLARHMRAPLLQTPTKVLAKDVAAEITRRRAVEVLVVGGTSVIPAATVTEIMRLGARVTRVAGTADSALAAAVAERIGGTSAVIVAPRPLLRTR